MVKDPKRHGKLVALRYPKTVSIDQIFAVDDALTLSRDTPYQELVKQVGVSNAHVPSGYKILKKKVPVTMCTVGKSSDENGFVVLFSISHVCADGFIYYAVLDMIFDGNISIV